MGLLSPALALAQTPPGQGNPLQSGKADDGKALFSRENLVAWCIVPFDSKKRGPEERAAMLERLGFKRFAYDWRAEHIPTFDAEIEALKKHGVALDAFWVAPGELNHESKLILDVLKRHKIKVQLWVLLDFGADKVSGAEQDRRVEAAVAKLRPLAEAAQAIGCTLALYNHGGWFGEPENQLAIIDRLKRDGVTNVGIVYNLHHGHAHVARFRELLALMKPHLLGLNLNGMGPEGDANGRKILPLGQGAFDLDLLRTIRDSGYGGPIGILGHTQDDAEERLKDNLDGLDWLLPQLEGKPAGPRPTPRTPVPGLPPQPKVSDADRRTMDTLIAESRAQGDPRRGAEVFAAAQFGCLSCHKVGEQGGAIGPELTKAGVCLTPEQIVESVLWPKRQVKDGYNATVVATTQGTLIQGYIQFDTERELGLREATSGKTLRLAKTDVEGMKEQGTLMPEGLAEAMTTRQRLDLVCFLMTLGLPGDAKATAILKQSHAPAKFTYEKGPIAPELWPNRDHAVNRDRIYDFYAKEAESFAKQPEIPPLLPAFPGLDGGRDGHWGNQNDDTWIDGRWNKTDLGSVLSGVFRGAGVTVPKGVCVRLGERGELAACFNPQTLNYEAVWQGGFVTISPRRHGLLEGLTLEGTPLERPAGKKPDEPFVYHGFYRHGKRVVFSYRVGDVELLDAPWVEEGRFSRVVAPAATHPLAALVRGGPPQWRQVLETKGARGETRPYAVDTIEVPFKNPWNALMFFGDHDFLADGTAFLCTMTGDVWRVDGIDGSLASVRWRRVASGLHHALGLVIAEDQIYVLGRDQITRLHDLNHDGEIDFYECVSNAYETSAAGHDFIAGLQRDPAGRFYTASGNQGLIRVDPNGKDVAVLATGFRNPDGLGLSPEGVLTVPCSEGDWTPASMICEIRPGGFYGYGGPKGGLPPDLPLVYMPRGLDNSSGGQVTVPDDRWGPLKGQMIHLSHGSGTHFLLLRDQVDGQPQGAAVPLPGDFLSGVHRARFNPKDGQLYLSGMTGWGTYTPADGSFQRVRYTGDPVQLPVELHARENGMLVTFSSPVDRAVVESPENRFAQAWNYRYGPGYGSQEFSPHHPSMPGHDALTIRSVTLLEDGRSLFLEIPDLQPVNQLHLHLRVDASRPVDLFATVHKLGTPFTGIPGYRPVSKVIAAHPILSDLALATHAKPNPWGRKNPNARPIVLEAGKNLTFVPASFEVQAGEMVQLTFKNPDVVPHNWALIRPDSLPRIGELVNKIIAEPDAVARHYIPKSDDVLVYADMVAPQDQFIISFQAPAEKGRYPYVCTFPGHWMVMNGVMIVK
ncbi:DUF6797 domain-containing protein [Singulisphaera sp. GP187]|uniref:DUF6797 domain-containing protein n=1 Tax=Singulisphaera sp. GP187 TaxID=1882752 RepID=UPI0020B11C1F|nr:DUF6797 domain-containing protein [Singulisphaera sp. GP187]